MSTFQLTDRASWLAARRHLLDEEKALNLARERVNKLRRQLPVVRVTTDYRFNGVDGSCTLKQLFANARQLIVYHFMFGESWSEGCPSCSFWADNYNGTLEHLAARNTALAAVSTASVEKLQAYRRRMGWSFNWVSSGGSTFNQDYGVTFDSGRPGPTGGYNYTASVPGEEMPGISVFTRLDDGGIGHCYSTYARGLDMLNGSYHLLDLTPLGRSEDDLPFPQGWIRRRDEYPPDSS
jgi:predicted dithiol-disulfide oxidoreductase (DUF899 family)